jgi:HAD superfamily hydrolase (TIGR01509 family)
MNKHSRYINGVLFDFDGTLTRPDALDLSVIKKKIGCPVDHFLLEYINRLPTPQKREAALAAVDRFEMQAAASAQPNPGAEEIIQYLRANDVRIGILTRNSLRSVQRALQNFKHTDLGDFDIIVSRDDPVKPKPSGDGVTLAAKRLNIPTSEIIMVGDYPLDIEAGERAGAVTVLLNHSTPSKGRDVACDYVVTQLKQLMPIVRMGRPLPGGKLPNDLLEKFLDQFGFEDPSVLIKPGIGEDTAAVDISEEAVMVLKSDPITFASDRIGKYSVLVNANDIVTSGARPRWFLSTLVFPIGTSALSIRQVMGELSEVCRQCRITLCGGHTEISDAVTRPIVTGMMIGTVAPKRLIDKRNIKAGDRVLLTKGVAVEGTAIIAREFSRKLTDIGISNADIRKCRRFLDHISILPEARLARDIEGVSAMHDVTEGGLATALDELSIAGGHRIKVAIEKIPIYPETAKICGLLKLDPLGLIGSGSLIICCRQYARDILVGKIRKAGIPIADIGEVRETGKGVEAVRDRQPAAWPTFEADEITRLF